VTIPGDAICDQIESHITQEQIIVGS